MCWGPAGPPCTRSALRAFLTVPVPPPSGLSQTRLRFAAPGSVLPHTGVRRMSLQKTFLIRGSSCWDEDHGQPWPGRGPGTAPSPCGGFRQGKGSSGEPGGGLVPAGPLLGREGRPRVREAGTPRGLPALSSSRPLTCPSVALGHRASMPYSILCHPLCSRPGLTPALSPGNVSLSVGSEYPLPAYRVWMRANPFPSGWWLPCGAPYTCDKRKRSVLSQGKSCCYRGPCLCTAALLHPWISVPDSSTLQRAIGASFRTSTRPPNRPPIRARRPRPHPRRGACGRRAGAEALGLEGSVERGGLRGHTAGGARGRPWRSGPGHQSPQAPETRGHGV